MTVEDANLIAYLLIRSSHTPLAERAYARDPLWISPAFWKNQFLNVRATAVRAGMLEERQSRATWRKALAAVVTRDDHDARLVLRFAVHRRISAYDANYVVLAKVLKTTVVTGDKDLAKRCPDVAVLLEDFAAQ